MAKTDGDDLTRVTLRLLRRGHTPATAFYNSVTLVTDPSKEADSITPKSLVVRTVADIEGAVAYLGLAYSDSAPWLEPVSALLKDKPPALGMKGPAGVIFVPVEMSIKNEDGSSSPANFTVALCFGMAHLMLDLDKFVDDFGVRVAIALLHANRITSTDTIQVTKDALKKRSQNSKPSNRTGLGIDIDKELLKAISGKSANPDFGASVSGGGGLSFNLKLAPDNIERCCKTATELFISEACASGFEWTKRFRPVTVDATLTTLDAAFKSAFDAAVAGTPTSDIALSPPAILEPDKIEGFRFSGVGKGANLDHPDFEAFVALLAKKKECPGLDELKSHYRIHAIVNKTKSDSWSIWKCLRFSHTIGGKTYTLLDGQWYLVSPDFITSLDAFCAGLTEFGDLPDVLGQGEMNEKKYNANHVLGAPTTRDWLCIDTKLAKGAGWNSSIEPCDFLTPKGEFVHIKDGTTSSKLSHLFNQGVVSAEALRDDGTFRKALKSLVRKLSKNAGSKNLADILPSEKEAPKLDRYVVVLAFLRAGPWSDLSQLPFFSKVTLRNTVMRLRELGFGVRVHRIPKDPDISKKAAATAKAVSALTSTAAAATPP